MRRWLPVIGLATWAAAAGMVVPVQAQEGPGAFSYEPFHPNVPYDGRFTFARIKYPAPLGMFGGRGRGGRIDYKWDHDYPRAERHFTKILNELTTIRPNLDASNIFALDDPALLKYPVAYVCEVGYWDPNEKEIQGLRDYLLKGGFLIVDDFAGERDWFTFAAKMLKVLPEARPVLLTTKQPIFDSFYRIETLEYTHPYYGIPSLFYGIFEDNDPSKRLMVIINFNNDMSEYWEFSDTGYFPIDLSNTAYKLGVNYLVYAFTR